jgi:preprotein translocase subunit SecY
MGNSGGKRKIIMDIKSLFGYVPRVRAPSKELSIKERIKWTGVAGLLFLLMGYVPLPIDRADIPYSYLQNPLYSSVFSLLALGLGPIITGILLMHVLLRFRILRLDLGDDTDRRFFYGMQKVLILVIALFEGLAFITGFGLAHGVTGFLLLMVLMVLGTVFLLYLDEYVVKWGIGSGLGLFVALGVAKALVFDGYLSLSEFFNGILTYNRFNISSILPLVFTIILAYAIYKTIKRATVYNLPKEKASGSYAMVIFFVSFMGASYYGSAGSMIELLSDGSFNPPLDGLLLPENWHKLTDQAMLLNVAAYLCISLPLAFIMSCFWIWFFGFYKLYSQPPDYRLKDKEKEIKDKLKTVIPISISIGIIMMPLGEMLSVFIGFLGTLYLISYLYRCSEEISGPKKSCPVCDSTVIEWLLPASWCIWECRDCGYRGAIAIDQNKQK